MYIYVDDIFFFTIYVVQQPVGVAITRMRKSCDKVVESRANQARGSSILESEEIVTMWPRNILIALTPKGDRGDGAQPQLFNKQNVNI